MSFLWPQYLWLPWTLPALPALYWWLLHRRGKPVLRYSSLAVVRETSTRPWRQHVPPALLFIACAALFFAAARPTAPLTLPWARSLVVLAMDVSLSMRVSDVKPTRMVAAQEAAKLFLRELPKGIDVALVTFAGMRSVYQNLGSRLQVQTRDTELTPALALVAAVLVLAAAGLSVLWLGSAAYPSARR